MRPANVLTLISLVLALALAGCEREHVNAYGTDPDEEEPPKEEQPAEDPGDPYEDPQEGGDNEQTLAALVVAERLTGSWRGQLDVEYFDQEQRKHTDSFVCELEMAQYRHSTLNGTGWETDYDGAGKKVLREPFTWYVDTLAEHPIHLKFKYREMVIAPYELDGSHFAGTMKNVDGLETDQFSLSRVK